MILFKKIVKIFSVIQRKTIHLIDYFSPKRYMKHYNKYLKKIGVNVIGEARFIHPSVDFDGAGYDKITIGQDAIISKNVIFLVHDYTITTGLQAIAEPIKTDAYFLKEIKVGKNCFIGANVILLPGTRVGDNCILGAGCVVRGNIPDDSIVVGNPAQIVGNTKEWAEKKKEKGEYYFNLK